MLTYVIDLVSFNSIYFYFFTYESKRKWNHPKNMCGSVRTTSGMEFRNDTKMSDNVSAYVTFVLLSLTSNFMKWAQRLKRR